MWTEHGKKNPRAVTKLLVNSGLAQGMPMGSRALLLLRKTVVRVWQGRSLRDFVYK